MAMTNQSGSWAIRTEGNLTYFHYRCPCGCGTPGYLRLVPMEQHATATERPVWGWNQDMDKPRLHPSIKRVGSCGFHGFFGASEWNVPAGCWRACEDSPPLAPDIIAKG